MRDETCWKAVKSWSVEVSFALKGQVGQLMSSITNLFDQRLSPQNQIKFKDINQVGDEVDEWNVLFCV